MEKTKRESETVILRFEGGMGLPPCCSTCLLFSSATIVCCYFHPTHACTNNKPISHHFSGIFLITQPGTLLKPKLHKTPATFLLAIMPWKPTLLANMVPFLPELSVRGEAAPKQANKASNCTRLHKVLITSLRPNKETFSLFLCPTHNSKSLPKANHINKKTCNWIPALALLVAIPHKET